MNLQPPDEHQLLVFWVSLLLLLVLARALGWLAQRLGQPAVVGELSAGLLAGPSVLGKLAPEASDWLFPADPTQSAMLMVVGWIGVVFLLVGTGYETDLGLIRSLGRAAVLVSTGSLVLPLVVGFLVGVAMPDLFFGEQSDRALFAFFMATALSISSLPIIAKILSEMGLLRRTFAQLNLAAGMVNDVVGWVLLGVIAGLARAGEFELETLVATLVGLVAFFVGAFTLGQWLIDRWLRSLRARGNDPVVGTSGVVILVLAAGALTQWIGVEAVLGAFMAGVLLGRSRFREHRLLRSIELITDAFFAPVFFAVAGLRVDLGLLGDPTVLGWGLVVVVAAAVSKYVGASVGARWAGLPRREGSAVGIGLNARGALEIVIASVGLALGVLNQASYTVVVLMAMATSIMTPPLLRAVLKGWRGTPEEQHRIRREEVLGKNLVVRAERLLLPSRGGPGSIMAAQILDLVWPVEVPATVLTVGPTGSAGDLTPIRNVLAERSVDFNRIRKGDGAEAVLKEARLGYGVIGVGLRGDRHEGKALSPFVEQLVAGTDLPVVVVRRGRSLDRALPWAYGTAVVPVSGSEASRAAQEVAMNLSSRIGTEVVLTTVVEADQEPVPLDPLHVFHLAEPPPIASRLLGQASDAAAEVGARWHTAVRYGESTAREVLGLVEDLQADLVVVGAGRREVEGESFLGQTVERLLVECPATVVVVVTPG